MSDLWTNAEAWRAQSIQSFAAHFIEDRDSEGDDVKKPTQSRMREFNRLAASLTHAYASSNSGLTPAQIVEAFIAFRSELTGMSAGKIKIIDRDVMKCLECGETFDSMKRHLREKHGMTPAQYKGKHGLPKDYKFEASTARSGQTLQTRLET